MGLENARRGLSDRLVQGTVKFGGGSLMIWGCMFWEGPGYTTKIDGNMAAEFFVSVEIVTGIPAHIGIVYYCILLYLYYLLFIDNY